MELGVDREELRTALGRVRVAADPATSAVALIADSTGPRPVLRVAAQDADGNRAEEPVSAEWDGGRQVLVVNAGFLEAMLAVHPSPRCLFRTGRSQGESLPPLLLEDKEAQVTGTVPQMVPHRMGYGERT
jgi:hypothetical protein